MVRGRFSVSDFIIFTIIISIIIFGLEQDLMLSESENQKIPESKIEITKPKTTLTRQTIRRQQRPLFAMAACYSAPDVNRVKIELEVALKSAVLFLKNVIDIIIFTDSKEISDHISSYVDKWPNTYKQKLNLTFHAPWYPDLRSINKDSYKFENLFKPCATQRIFFPLVFPKIDSLIYIDIDVIFLKSPEKLWMEFQNLNENHLASMSLRYKTNRRKNKNLFNNIFEVNDGVFLMNMTKMRAVSPKGWTEQILNIYKKFREEKGKESEKLYDQDLISLYFTERREEIRILPCSWNYRGFLCEKPRDKCRDAADMGISLIHGAGERFYSERSLKFKVLFDIFKNWKLGEDSLTDLLFRVSEGLRKLTNDLRDKRRIACKDSMYFDENVIKTLKNSIFMNR